VNVESCSFADLAVHSYETGVVLDDPVGRSQTQTGASPFVLGCEERIEDLFLGGCIHPDAVVRDCNSGKTTGFDLMRIADAFRQRNDACL